MTTGRTLATLTAGTAAVGALALGYALVEARSYVLRRVSVPVLAPGSAPLRLLHLSDLHLTPRHHGKLDFVAGLAALEPDVVVNTGDNHAHPDAHPLLINALGRLLDVPGVFVHGSNDYFAPTSRNWLAYLAGDTGRGADAPAAEEHRELPWRELDASLLAGGWRCLDNGETGLEVAGQRILFRGTDDAHLGLDRYDVVAGPAPDDTTLRIGVTHGPYLRVLDAMVDDGTDLILAGHTHGGQVCVPGYGALVSNCDLEPARASGLSTHAHRGRHAALHVSAGLGTSPYAPIRFACRPAATLLTLIPR